MYTWSSGGKITGFRSRRSVGPIQLEWAVGQELERPGGPLHDRLVERPFGPSKVRRRAPAHVQKPHAAVGELERKRRHVLANAVGAELAQGRGDRFDLADQEPRSRSKPLEVVARRFSSRHPDLSVWRGYGEVGSESIWPPIPPAARDPSRGSIVQFDTVAGPESTRTRRILSGSDRPISNGCVKIPGCA